MAKQTKANRGVSGAREKSAAGTVPTGRAGKKAAVKNRRPFVIDLHSHVVVPEVVAFAQGHVVKGAPPNDPRISAEALRAAREWGERTHRKMVDLQERLRDMDETGVDMQVLTPSLVHQNTNWAEPEMSLKMERLTNERVAGYVAVAPDRFVGFGGVPLQSPALAVQELERCTGELGLRGVQISSTAGAMELGDPALRPFWAAAEKTGAVVYIHPAGETSSRYAKFHLWNSVGQPLEEAMAMGSLFYEGVLDAFPKLKICIAHGGGYLPFYAGRVDRNYLEKPFTRVNMSKSPSEYMKQHFWYDTCLYNQDMLEYLVSKVGSSRIVMGSDYPVGEGDPVGFITTSRKLSAADKAAILGKNAAALLGIAI
jgi:aminocarboxymuconate-semialdehyde decarboxylase